MPSSCVVILYRAKRKHLGAVDESDCLRLPIARSTLAHFWPIEHGPLLPLKPFEF